ncbi:hypothetical protein H5397_12405 [Propioniciclava sp. MC1683]|uniref:hypothetical protein n=1 Tax=Propioniciclava sp. MC1683 TaxID=2760309 RepID=UPI001600E4DC|nr:hypothetical protein [Propioniciclava sp. MC1683]MBB1502216.1 hypothetical protein [Propioniciclava sp. MC1683]
MSNMFGKQDPTPQHHGKWAGQPTGELPAGVVAVEAASGPMARHQEQLQQLRVQGVTTPRIAITGVSGVDEEVIEMVRLEMLELCEVVGFPTEPLIELYP